MAVLLAVLVGTGGSVTGVRAAAARAGALPGNLTAHDESSARELARAAGQRVEILSALSETRRAWSLPNGDVQVEMHMSPERVRTAAGQWVPVDLNLTRRPDGSVAPGAHPYGLWLSGGRPAGTEDLVRIGEMTRRTTLGWRGPLPSPTLSGARATYAGVRPGVDLVIEATVTGFEYFLMVSGRAAAAEVREVAMPWTVPGMTPMSGPDGALTMRSATGDTVALPVAEMWDAAVSPVSGERVRRAPVAMSTVAGPGGGTDLVLTPSAEFFARSDLVWPVTIDPPVTLNPAFDAFVQNTYSSDQSAASELKLGYVVDAAAGCSSACRARSFLRFDNLGGYDGTRVVSAELFVWNFHSWSCRAASWEAWRTGSVSSSVRWTNQPSWAEKDGASTGTKGYNSSCADGWVSVSVRKTFQASFDSGPGDTATVGLRATNEGSNTGWKRFNSANASSRRPYVSLVYNRRPNTPTGMAVSDCASQCASPAVVSRMDPELRVRASDPDGGTLSVNFQVYDGVSSTPVRTGTKTGYPSGSSSPAAWRITPVLTAVGWYRWRAQACDSQGMCGSWTAYFEFTTDVTAPPPPAVAPADPALYFEDDGSGATSGGIGVPGRLRLTGVADVHHFNWRLDGGAVSPDVPATGTNPRTASIDVVPLMDMVRVVTVEAYDAAGRKGVTTYMFNVASPEPEAGRFWLDGNTDNELSTNDATATAAGVSWVAGHAGEGQAAHLTGAGMMTTPYPVLATVPNPALTPTVPRSFAVAAWAKLDTSASGYYTVVAQRGSHSSFFELGYRGDTLNNWCFSILHSDTGGAVADRACATAPVAFGQWVHLAGVYDAVNRRITLYVNGGSNLFGETVVADHWAAPFAAHGSFMIGASWDGTAPWSRWIGDIDDVAAYQRVIPEEEVWALALG
jgi:hypothetical protein